MLPARQRSLGVEETGTGRSPKGPTRSSEPPHLTAGQHEYAVQLGRYWGQFAAIGDPNGVGLPAWRPVNDGYIQYLETGRTGGTRAVPSAKCHEDHKFGFWSPLVHPDPSDR